MFLLFILPLTAVLVPSHSSPKCPGSTLDESVINGKILTLINGKRQDLKNGGVTDGATPPNPLPTATEMNDLEWDCDLETAATGKLGGCTPAGEPPADTGNTGFYYVYSDTSTTYSADIVVKIWLGEVQQQPWPDPIPPTSTTFTMPANSAIKNFANLMRADTTKIGCAELPCTNAANNNQETYVFCLTDKDPLGDNEKIYEVLCTSDTQCATSDGTKPMCYNPKGVCYAPCSDTRGCITALSIYLKCDTTTRSCYAPCTKAGDCDKLGQKTKCDITTGSCYAPCTGEESCTTDLGIYSKCDTTTGSCYAPCKGEEGCTDVGTKTKCDTTTGSCYAPCTNAGDCTDLDPKTKCDIPTGSCYAPCTGEEGCTALGTNTKCDTTTGSCYAPCTGDGGCADLGTKTKCYKATSSCYAPCTNNEGCTTDLGIYSKCDTTTGSCYAPCINNKGCTDVGTKTMCDTTTGSCYAPCTGEEDCANLGTKTKCDTTTGSCYVPCTGDGGCANLGTKTKCYTATSSCYAPCTNVGDCTALDPKATCNITTGLCYAPVETTTSKTTTTTTTAATTTTSKTTTTTTTAVTGLGVLPEGTNTFCNLNGMTDELRIHFLDTQNYRRSILATGQVQRPSNRTLPNGANIIKLKPSCTLEKEAIQEVVQCPTSKTPHGKYGKNFDTFASSAVTSTYRDAIKKAVTNWWKVVRTESNGPGMQVTFRSNHVNQPVESYTQIAWANTKYIGCAIAKCYSSYTVICLYEPKGNIVNEVLYKIGGPCTNCPDGTKCDSALGLCEQLEQP